MMQLTLDNLKDLDDGRVMVAFAQELRRAVMDCMDRPGETQARTVALEFAVSPVVGEEGMCEEARGDFKIKSKVPVRKTKSYSFAVNKRGDLAFSSNSPDNVNQTTIHDVDPKTGKVSR